MGASGFHQKTLRLRLPAVMLFTLHVLLWLGCPSSALPRIPTLPPCGGVFQLAMRVLRHGHKGRLQKRLDPGAVLGLVGA